MSKRIKIQFGVAFSCIIVLFVLVGTLWYFMLDRRLPVEVIKSEIMTMELGKGDPLIVNWVLHKKRQCTGLFTRQIIDSDRVVWDIHSDNENTYLPVSEKPVVFNKAYILPKGISKGKAKFRTIILWQCNPLRSMRQQIADIDFNIID